MGDLMQRLQSAIVFEDADDCSGDLLKADVLAQITALQAENARLRAACEASLPLMQAVDREEVTDVADWHAAEALIRAALQQET